MPSIERPFDCQMNYWKPTLSLGDEWSEQHRLVYCKAVINGDLDTENGR